MMELVCTCFRSDGFCDHEMSIFARPSGTPDLFFSKQPSDIKLVEKLLEKDTNLFVIGMMRDPRSVITSVHKGHPGQYFCNFRVWKQCNDGAQRLIGHPRFILIKYADLVSDPDRVQAEIMHRFDFLEKQHAFSEYGQHAAPSSHAETAMGSVRAVTPDRLKGWQAHLPRLKSELLKYPELPEVLIACGYEEGSSWLRLLDDVEPEEHPCRYPDKAPLLKTIDYRVRNWRKIRQYLKAL